MGHVGTGEDAFVVADDSDLLPQPIFHVRLSVVDGQTANKFRGRRVPRRGQAQGGAAPPPPPPQ